MPLAIILATRWKKVKLELVKLNMCPVCGSLLKNSLWSSKDIFTNKKIYRCKACDSILKFEDGKWQKIVKWYEEPHHVDSSPW